MAGINQQSRLVLKYADKQGSASYGGLREEADGESILKTAEAILSLQDGCAFEQVGKHLSYELVLE